MDNVTKFHGIIGDINPIEHGGGVVFERGHGVEMIYFQGWHDGEGERVSVYEIIIEADVVKDLTWVDWKSVASCVGLKEEELTAYSDAPSPTARAQVYESVGFHSGFSELDPSPLHMSLEEAEKQYGAFVDEASK